MPPLTDSGKAGFGSSARPGPLVLAAAVLAWAMLLGTPSAAESLRIDAGAQYDLAQSALRAREFDRAVVEFERFLHFFPDEPRADTARFRIAGAHFEMRRLERARKGFEALTVPDPTAPLAVEAWFMMSRCDQLAGDSGRAVATLENLLRAGVDGATRDAVNYRIGWIFLEAGRFDPATGAFARVSPAGRRRLRLEALSQELSAFGRQPRKNPTTAGLLALIPGAGHLYTGRYRDAAVALVLTGLPLLAAGEAFDNDSEALGVLLAGVGLSFYSASIYSAVSAAHKTNRARQRDTVERLRREYRPAPSAGRRSPGIGLLAEVRF